VHLSASDIHQGSNSSLAIHQTPTEATEFVRFSKFLIAWLVGRFQCQAPVRRLSHVRWRTQAFRICAVPRTPPSRFRPREKRSWRMSRRMRRRLPSLGIILDFCVNLALPRCDLQWSTPQVDLYGLHFDFDKATMRPGNPVTSARVGSCPAATTHNVVPHLSETCPLAMPVPSRNGAKTALLASDQFPLP
jgi:hypothetical protein